MANTLDTTRRNMLRLVLRIFRRRVDDHGVVTLEEWSDYLQRSARMIKDYERIHHLFPWSVQAKTRTWRFDGERARCGDGRWSKIVMD